MEWLHSTDDFSKFQLYYVPDYYMHEIWAIYLDQGS